MQAVARGTPMHTLYAGAAPRKVRREQQKQSRNQRIAVHKRVSHLLARVPGIIACRHHDFGVCLPLSRHAGVLQCVRP